MAGGVVTGEWRQSSELEDDLLRLGVAELGEVGQAGVLDHGRRPAHEHEALLLGAGLG